MISFFIETLDEFLDHAIPGDQSRTLEARIAQPAAYARLPASQEPRTPALRGWVRHHAARPVFDELQRSACVGRRDATGLASQKGFQRGDTVVFIEWTIDSKRTRIQNQSTLAREGRLRSRCGPTAVMPPVFRYGSAACRLQP